nr:hypothetical protein Iba_chr10cCG5540 [Ipomoea batatas]
MGSSAICSNSLNFLEVSPTLSSKKHLASKALISQPSLSRLLLTSITFGFGLQRIRSGKELQKRDTGLFSFTWDKSQGFPSGKWGNDNTGAQTIRKHIETLDRNLKNLSFAATMEEGNGPSQIKTNDGRRRNFRDEKGFRGKRRPHLIDCSAHLLLRELASAEAMIDDRDFRTWGEILGFMVEPIGLGDSKWVLAKGKEAGHATFGGFGLAMGTTLCWEEAAHLHFGG